MPEAKRLPSPADAGVDERLVFMKVGCLSLPSYVHSPSGDAIVRLSPMDLRTWEAMKAGFFAKYPHLAPPPEAKYR